MDVPRGRSRIPSGVEGELRRIAARIPFAVITSKDFAFVHPRTIFARAWACANGLEIRDSRGEIFTRRNLPDMRNALSYVRKNLRSVHVERKEDASGKLLGFSIDWRKRRGPPRLLLERMLDGMRREGFWVSRNRSDPFIDVFASKPDKGEALLRLVELLGLDRRVGIFMGDSPMDNGAFEKSHVSVCVAHGQSLEGLKCRYVVEFPKMQAFLSSLLENGLDFTPRLRYVSRVGD